MFRFEANRLGLHRLGKRILKLPAEFQAERKRTYELGIDNPVLAISADAVNSGKLTSVLPLTRDTF